MVATPALLALGRQGHSQSIKWQSRENVPPTLTAASELAGNVAVSAAAGHGKILGLKIGQADEPALWDGYSRGSRFFWPLSASFACVQASHGTTKEVCLLHWDDRSLIN